jgi:hypothetical protein
MELLTLANQCCYRTGDTPIRSLFENEDNALEWFGYISQAANLIKDEHRWSVAKRDMTIITSGNKAEYDLPSDFEEMATYQIYNITNQRFIPCASDDEELYKQATRNVSQSTIRFRIINNKIVFTYPIEDGITLKYTYLTKNICKNFDANNNVYYSDHFEKDTDEFIYDNELLILKSIALRAVNLGLPEAERREADYVDKLEKCMAKDGGNMKFNLYAETLVNKTTPVLWSQY